MIPLAVAGPLIIVGVVSLALLAMWWLLRNEQRETAEERAEQPDEQQR